MERQQASLPRSTLLFYAVVALPLATIGLPLTIYLAPFYAGEIGIPLAALGTAMLLARLVDVIVDPFIGTISDRWRPRAGRRKIWLPIGGLMLLCGVFMLFRPAPSVGIVYFIFWTTIVYVGFTATKIPYEAWGAELSRDYAGRTRIASARQLFTLIGLVVATTVPALILARGESSAADVLAGMSWLMIGLLPLAIALAFFLVPDHSPPQEKSTRGMARNFRLIARNGPFRRISIALFLGYIAETFRVTITVFFARDVIGVPNIGAIYVYYFLTGLAAIPFWMWLGNRWGKHKALILAFCVVIATNTGIFFLEVGQVTTFTILFVAKGFCFGALELLPAAMIADTVDVDVARTRQQRQGLFFALIGIVIKIGQAIGQGLSLNLLALVGYDAAGNNSQAATDSLRLLYCIFPTVFLVIAIALIAQYPLTAVRHARLRAGIERRDAALRHLPPASAPVLP
jgi:Na+/melibiose symporter-like transporter